MKQLAYLLLLLCTVAQFQFTFAQSQLPSLRKQGEVTQFIVDGKPFIMLGGELGNSSASTIQNMQAIWPKLKAMHLNTVLIPVYWELLEPQEGKYDFTLLRDLINEARKNELKIVFLWFGSWKNSMSSHAPAWVKLNQDKYPRVKDNTGRSQEILSSFSENNLQADLRAFEQLMGFIKAYDGTQHTVIMVQVENEIGMLPSARDHHSLANAVFQKPVPTELIKYLQQNKEKLVPEFLQIWKNQGYKTTGNWEEVFGKGLHADEIFMAWYYALFANKITAAGKKIHPLPMFVNAALNRPGREPGNYPSAGPLPHLMDVWKAASPAIDFMAPDFYNPDFKHWNDLYTRQGDPLFVPEHRFDPSVAAKAIYAIGHYNALGFSPFSIESSEKPSEEGLGKMYQLIESLTPLITANQGKGKIEGVLLDKTNSETMVRMGKYEFTFKHEFTLGWSPGASAAEWPMAGAMLIQTGEDEFYLAGTGVVVTFKPVSDPALNIGILKVDEGAFEQNQWKILRHLNGDQTHQGRHVRIPYGQYGVQRVELYGYR